MVVGGRSGMDKERARELMRGGSRRGRLTGARRQQRAISGHIISSNNNKNKPPSSPSVADDSSSGKGEGDAMERWKKERAGGVMRCSGNDDEGGGGESGEDAARLQGKVSEDWDAVDPAVVPRRLRSAINKRSHQSASQPLADSKRKQHLGPNGTQLSSLVNGTRRFKQSMLLEPITKDEEEVAETLSALASLIPVSKPIKEERRLSEEITDMKATSVSLSEASKEGGEKFLLPCTGAEATNPSCVEELSEETVKAEPSVREQHITVLGSQNFDLESNGTAEPDFQRTPTSKNEQAESTCSRDAMKSSIPFGASLHLHSGNGVLPPTQFDPLIAPKPEIIGIWPLGSASGEKKLQFVMQKPDGGAHNMCRKETTVDVRHGLPSSGYGHPAMPSSSKARVLPDSITGVDRPNSTGNDLPTEKLPLMSANGKWSCKRCTIHVYISQLIQNHQNSEKKQQIPCPSNQLNAKDSRNSDVQTSNVRNSMTSAGANGPVMERNIHEDRIQMIQDGRHVQAQQPSILPGTYALQKQVCDSSAQVCDFLSLLATGETSSPGNAVKSSGQLHTPYLHSQVPHHPMLPFTFPHGCYTSPHTDQLSAAASQQVQLQLPHYIEQNDQQQLTICPFYGQHMVHAGGTTKQQQQMWQAQVAHYRLQLGNLGIHKRLDGRQHDSSSSLLLSSAQPPSIFPPPSEMLVGGAYHPPNLQQLLPIPSSSSSRSKQQHQHHDGGRFGPDGPAQLQLLCNAQHM